MAKQKKLAIASEIISESENTAQKMPDSAKTRKSITKGGKTVAYARFNLWLPTDTIKSIKALAYGNETTIAEVSRVAIEEYLAKPENARTIKRYK
jgi:hypothetical protein